MRFTKMGKHIEDSAKAKRVIHECLTGMAMRKMGLTDKHYLSPLKTDHGRKK